MKVEAMYKFELANKYKCTTRTLRRWVLRMNAKLNEQQQPIVDYGSTGMLPPSTVKKIFDYLGHPEE